MWNSGRQQENAAQDHNPRVGGSSPSSGMKFLQTVTFRNVRTRGFSIRGKIRVLERVRSAHGGACDIG